MCGKNCLIRSGKDRNSKLAALTIVSRTYTGQVILHSRFLYSERGRTRDIWFYLGKLNHHVTTAMLLNTFSDLSTETKFHDYSGVEGKIGILVHIESSFESAAPIQSSHPDQLELACFVIFHIK